MAALIIFLFNLGASLFKSKTRLEAENAALRQQLIVLRRKVRGRVQFTNMASAGKAALLWMYGREIAAFDTPAFSNRLGRIIAQATSRVTRKAS
jgi:hypothetical protein